MLGEHDASIIIILCWYNLVYADVTQVKIKLPCDSTEYFAIEIGFAGSGFHIEWLVQCDYKCKIYQRIGRNVRNTTNLCHYEYEFINTFCIDTIYTPQFCPKMTLFNLHFTRF